MRPTPLLYSYKPIVPVETYTHPLTQKTLKLRKHSAKQVEKAVQAYEAFKSWEEIEDLAEAPRVTASQWMAKLGIRRSNKKYTYPPTEKTLEFDPKYEASHVEQVIALYKAHEDWESIETQSGVPMVTGAQWLSRLGIERENFNTYTHPKTGQTVHFSRDIAVEDVEESIRLYEKSEGKVAFWDRIEKKTKQNRATISKWAQKLGVFRTLDDLMFSYTYQGTGATIQVTEHYKPWQVGTVARMYEAGEPWSKIEEETQVDRTTGIQWLTRLGVEMEGLRAYEHKDGNTIYVEKQFAWGQVHRVVTLYEEGRSWEAIVRLSGISEGVSRNWIDKLDIRRNHAESNRVVHSREQQKDYAALEAKAIEWRREEDMLSSEIAERLGVPPQTVCRWLRRVGLGYKVGTPAHRSAQLRGMYYDLRKRFGIDYEAAAEEVCALRNNQKMPVGQITQTLHAMGHPVSRGFVLDSLKRRGISWDQFDKRNHSGNMRPTAPPTGTNEGVPKSPFENVTREQAQFIVQEAGRIAAAYARKIHYAVPEDMIYSSAVEEAIERLPAYNPKRHSWERYMGWAIYDGARYAYWAEWGERDSARRKSKTATQGVQRLQPDVRDFIMDKATRDFMAPEEDPLQYDPEQILLAQESERELQRVVQLMSHLDNATERFVMHALYLRGWAVKEIAAYLGLSDSRIRHLHGDALHKVRKIAEAYVEEVY